jgi:DNA-binding MarR family transcriptional regulator
MVTPKVCIGFHEYVYWSNTNKQSDLLEITMNHTQLRSFHAVAAEGGFTAASRVLNIGQPTITSQVKALEQHFDVELFHRRGRRVELTDAGEELFRIT